MAECTGAVTFKDHPDLVGVGTSGVGGVAAVHTRLRNCEVGPVAARRSVGALEPHHIRQGASVSFTHQIFGVTVEHRDCPWEFGDVDDGLIWWEANREDENTNSCSGTCVELNLY